MPIRLTFGCSECAATWQHLFMTKEEASGPPPPCPNGCRKKPEQELSAPGLNRGAPDTGITIPQSQAGREKLAADLALKGTGMGDINSHMKPGDIAAKPLPAPAVPADVAKMAPSLREQVTPRFLPSFAEAVSAGAADPAKSRNLGLIGGINRKYNRREVNPFNTIHRPTKTPGQG